jgi:hypothetical protein
MRRNSGIIGTSIETSLNTAVGIYDTFDQYNAKKNNSWPGSPGYISLSPNSGNYNEGSTINFTFTTANIPNSTTLYWTVTQTGGTVNSSDFSSISGSFSISGNSGSFSISLIFDAVSEPGDSFQVYIRTGSTSGPVVYTSGNFNINNPTFSVTPNVSSVNEGGSVIFTITTTSINDSTTLYYTLEAVTGTINSSDFSGGVTSGSMTITSATASVTSTLSNDVTTEGTEVFRLALRFGSTSGTVLAYSSNVTINDTSLAAPSATVTPNVSSKNEDGTNVIFTVNTTNFSSGTLFWTINTVAGTITASDFTQNQTTGTISISGSTGSLTLTIRADSTTEGTEQFQLQVRTDSLSGTVIGTSSTVTINDTSTGGITNPTRTDFPVAGRASFQWNRSSSNTTYETPSGWTYTFPSGTPLGHYYLVLWNDYASNNTSPTASTSYRTRRVFSLHVVSSYNYASRVATAANLPSISGSGSFERIQAVRITNTTRGQLMADVVPGTTVDAQYNTVATTIMVVPGDTITMSVLLQGPYTEYANWTHNAEL